MGDDDEGRAFALGEEWEDRNRATLESVGWWLDDPEFRTSSHPRSRWLGLAPLGTRLRPRTPPAGAAPHLDVRSFHDGGYAVVEGHAGRAPMRALFDAGPLGFGPLAAHGHADALSLLLRMGEDLLVDPGTGSYHGDPEWREALRGTRAHNTIEVDGLDQSEPRGLFLWGRKAEAHLVAAGASTPLVHARRPPRRLRGPRASRDAAPGDRLRRRGRSHPAGDRRGARQGDRAAVTRWPLEKALAVAAEAGASAGFRVRYPGGAELVLRACPWWPMAMRSRP